MRCSQRKGTTKRIGPSSLADALRRQGWQRHVDQRSCKWQFDHPASRLEPRSPGMWPNYWPTPSRQENIGVLTRSHPFSAM